MVFTQTGISLISLPGKKTQWLNIEVMKKTKKKNPGTSLVVQWLRLFALNSGGLGSIPDQGTINRSLQLKIPACHS